MAQMPTDMPTDLGRLGSFFLLAVFFPKVRMSAICISLFPVPSLLQNSCLVESHSTTESRHTLLKNRPHRHRITSIFRGIIEHKTHLLEI